MGAAVDVCSAYTSDLNLRVRSSFLFKPSCSSARLLYDCRFTGKSEGNERRPSSNPIQSVLPRSLLIKFFPVDCVFQPILAPTVKKLLLGTSFVVTCTRPPANSPVRSGVAVLLIII